MENKDLAPRKDVKAGASTPGYPSNSRPDHERDHRVINPSLPPNGTRYFSGVLLRYITSFLLGVISAAFFLGSKSRDVSDLLEWKGKTQATLERMDRDGTNASKLKVDQETAQIQANMAQINELYKRLEPIGAMQAKIERLQHDMDTVKK